MGVPSDRSLPPMEECKEALSLTYPARENLDVPDKPRTPALLPRNLTGEVPTTPYPR